MKNILFFVIFTVVHTNSTAQVLGSSSNFDLRVSDTTLDCSCEGFFNLVENRDTLKLDECIQNGLDPNCKLYLIYRYSESYALFRSRLVIKNSFITPMQYAICTNNIEVVRWLHKKKVNLDQDLFFGYNDLDQSDLIFQLTMPYIANSCDAFETYHYLRQNGVWSSQEKDEVLEQFNEFMSNSRSKPNNLDSLERLIEHIDGRALYYDEFLIYHAILYNIPQAYTYLFEEQMMKWETPIPFYLEGSGAMFPHGNSWTFGVSGLMKNCRYPTIELIDYFLEKNMITENDFHEFAYPGKYWIDRGRGHRDEALFRNYYKKHLKIKEGSVLKVREHFMHKRMDVIREKLKEWNGI